MTLFKEMIYQAQSSHEVLVDNAYKGYRYMIISYGQYPCAYVALESWHPCYKKQYDHFNIDCHGGLSYSEHGLRAPKKNGRVRKVISNDFWVIGWDYNHVHDYNGAYESEQSKKMLGNFLLMGKKWTTQEIIEEVKEVIEQLDFIYDGTKVYA